VTILSDVAAVVVAAFVAVLSVVLSMLAMILIAHLTTATWFGAFRARAERVVSALPALSAVGMLIVVPLVIVLSRPAVVATPVANPARQWFMAPWFIALRALVYWIVWLAISAALRTARRMESQGDIAAAARRVRVTSCAGLLALAVTMTFASFDWMMSLTAGWWSTIYGIGWFAGGMVGALSMLALPLEKWWPDPASPPIGVDQRRALGKLLLTFILFWLYTGFAQYIVMWSADIPREIVWYIPRTRGGWGIVALALVVVGGAIPFLALVSGKVRQSAPWLAALGALLLVVHGLDSYWLVIPGLVPFRWWMALLSLPATIAVAAPVVVASREGPRHGPRDRSIE
jgi:hypothetical protein